MPTDDRDTAPGVTCSFTRFSDMAIENGLSRVNLGVHFRFDGTIGNSLGFAIGDYVGISRFGLIPAPGAVVLLAAAGILAGRR